IVETTGHSPRQMTSAIRRQPSREARTPHVSAARRRPSFRPEQRLGDTTGRLLLDDDLQDARALLPERLLGAGALLGSLLRARELRAPSFDELARGLGAREHLL